MEILKRMDEYYEIVIIGAGIAGLTCGALLAKDGRKVLVVEKNPSVGGYCGSFEKNGFTFDLVSILLGCSENGKIYRILKEMGTVGSPKFIRIRRYLTIFLASGEVIKIPSEIASLTESLSTMFPHEAGGIKSLFSIMEGIYNDLFITPDRLNRPLNFLSSRYLRRYTNSTFRELLDEFINDEKLKYIFSVMAVSFGGMSVERVSALYISNIIMTFFKEGGYIPAGGMQELPMAISNALKGHGGTLVLSHKANRIYIENNIVKGVGLSDGRLISTSCVISTIDVTQLFLDLIGKETIPERYLNRLMDSRISNSSFVVNLGLDLSLEGLPLSHMTMFLSASDLDELNREIERMENGDMDRFCIAHIPTLHDSSLAPEGNHVVNLLALSKYDCRDWDLESDTIAEKMISNLERLIPGVSDHIVYKSIITPHTLQKYGLNHRGACYGWSHTPEQFGIRRLQNRTPIDGLFLAGHWTIPGGGITASMISGFIASTIARQYIDKINICT